MMNRKFLLLILGATLAVNAATIKDVKLACKASKCSLVFQFASAADLPTFFQKFDPSTNVLTVGFSETKFALGEHRYDIDESSQYVRSMFVYSEPYRDMDFLKIQMNVGPALASDKNEISLDGKNFSVSLNGSKEKGWVLSKLYAKYKKEAQKAELLEKKRLAEEKKAAEKQAILDKKAAAKAALEEKKRLAEEKKAAAKQAILDKKAAAKAALEEKKRLAEEQKLLDKAIKEGGKVSALLPQFKEMTVLIGSGMEQFRLVTENPISIENVSGPDKKSVIVVSMDGPAKSPVFKVNAGSMIKSIGWGEGGIRIQLQSGAKPAIVVQEGALILQKKETALKKDGFVFWTARPDGIFTRNWMSAFETKPDYEAFVNKYDSDSKKIVSASQTFHLRPVVRELIVVADETEFYASASDKSQVLKRLIFGDRLVSLDATGLYRKVQFENRVGYVNKRAVGFFDELSSVQAERLKQVDQERNGELPDGAVASMKSSLDGFYEDRIIYSSFGRRDPFVEIKGLVEEGINIDQVELVGIIWESEVPMAILVETKNPSVSYTIKEGDKILNGKVLKITQTDVLFLIQEFGVSRRYSMGLPDKFGGQK